MSTQDIWFFANYLNTKPRKSPIVTRRLMDSSIAAHKPATVFYFRWSALVFHILKISNACHF